MYQHGLDAPVRSKSVSWKQKHHLKVPALAKKLQGRALSQATVYENFPRTRISSIKWRKYAATLKKEKEGGGAAIKNIKKEHANFLFKMREKSMMTVAEPGFILNALEKNLLNVVLKHDDHAMTICLS